MGARKFPVDPGGVRPGRDDSLNGTRLLYYRRHTNPRPLVAIPVKQCAFPDVATSPGPAIRR